MNRTPRLLVTKSDLAGSTFLLATVALASFVIVVPNAFRVFSFPLLCLSAVLGTLASRDMTVNTIAFLAWLGTTTVTLLYLGLGILKGHTEAVAQVLFVYIVSPAFWLIICSQLLRMIPESRWIRVMIILSVLGALTVFLFYGLYIVYGPSALLWVIAQPNVNYENGTAKATMHVFGSLMFVSGGVVASPFVLRRWWSRIGVIVLLFVVAIMSGRTAFLLSFVVGAMILVTSLSRRPHAFSTKSILVGLLMVALGIGLLTGVMAYLELDITSIVRDSLHKIAGGGGDERVEQFTALIDGIKTTSLLGAGHGVGVSLVRSERFPWRYELLWLATVYRVGVLGTLVYAFPIIFILYRYGKAIVTRVQSRADDFVFGGFLAMLIASATNPYLESFEFQWMLALPFAWFCLDLSRGQGRSVSPER